MDNPERPGRGDAPVAVVYHDPSRERGAPVEPEEQAAEVVQPIETFVTIGSHHLAQDIPLHSLPHTVQEAAARAQAHIAHQTSAGELAASVMVRCQNCVYFYPEGWQFIKKDAEASGAKDRLMELNVIRGLVEQTQNLRMREMHDDGGGNLDLEHALNSFGVCRALTEHFKETIIVHPVSTCPDDAPFSFKPRRTLEHRKAAAEGYDWIMAAAQRGGPRR